MGEWSVKNGHITKDDDGSISKSTGKPEITVSSIVSGLICVESNEGNVEYESWLEHAIEDPFPENESTEALVLKSNFVVLGVLHKSVSSVFLIEQGENHDWEGSENNVEDLINPLLIEHLTRESWIETEPELWHDKENVLVESIAY